MLKAEVIITTQKGHVQHLFYLLLFELWWHIIFLTDRKALLPHVKRKT